MELIVEYRYPQTNGEAPQGFRLTVGTTNMIEHERFKRLAREAWQWWEARCAHRNGSAGSLPDDTQLVPQPDDPDWIVTTAGLRRAYMLAALRKVEVLRAGGTQTGGTQIAQIETQIRTDQKETIDPIRVNLRASASSADNPDGQVWEVGELPAEWESIEGMAQHCPADLFEAWAAAVERCNPRLYWPDQGDWGKARAGTTVSASPNSSTR